MVHYNSEAYARYEDNHPRFWNKIREQKVLEMLKPKTDDKILDIGCDTGWLVRKLMDYSKNAVGIDINITGLKIANMQNLFCMDLTNMGFSDSSFDKIVCIHTIEHVQQINKAFEEMARVLKPTGIILLIYPFEIIRGICAIGSAWAMYPPTSKVGKLHIYSISEAREQHVHKLSPRKISKLIGENGLCSKGSIMFMEPWPTYLTILERRR